MITVKELTKTYGTQNAIDAIDFQIGAGEIVGFLGPNGAGKTTTMKIITCFMPPTKGTVEVDHLNIHENSLEIRKRIGYLPEHNPPLRNRVGDAALLAHAFLRRFATEEKRGAMTLREDALRAIEAHRWPGNVRELENCIKRAVIMADSNQITAEDACLNEPTQEARTALDPDPHAARARRDRHADAAALDGVRVVHADRAGEFVPAAASRAA